MIKYVSQLHTGDAVVYCGHLFAAERTPEKIIISRCVLDNETEEYRFALNGHQLIDVITPTEARERAFIYWTGTLTERYGQQPSRSEVEKKVDESWSGFMGPFEVIAKDLTSGSTTSWRKG